MSEKNVITINDAAELLGVSTMTLRRWDKAKKLKSHRHPINHYRLYRKDEILKVKKKIEGK